MPVLNSFKPMIDIKSRKAVLFLYFLVFCFALQFGAGAADGPTYGAVPHPVSRQPRLLPAGRPSTLARSLGRRAAVPPGSLAGRGLPPPAGKRRIAQASVESVPAEAAPPMQIWRSGRLRGANVSLDASPRDLSDLTGWGANVVVVTLSSDVVDPDPPYRLKTPGLQNLDRFLSAARDAGLRVVVGFLAAPGRRAVSDRRLWERPEAHLAFARIWREVAARYLHDPTIIGYDLLSEPDPEVVFGGVHRDDLMKGTTADWSLLAKRLTLAIRDVDPWRPIIVEPGAWAYARGFAWLRPTGDSSTVYSFHMYSPHRYTHQGPNETIPYPGRVPAYTEPEGMWDKASLDVSLKPARDFQRRYGVPLFVGEFGVRRIAPGGDAYIRDLLTLFEEAGWHWAFWSYRASMAWDPEYGADPTNRALCTPASAPLMRVYREFLALNDHPTFLQDLPLLKDDSWVAPMRAVHRSFAGTPGTVGLFGDSLTCGAEFMTPLFSGGYTADPKTLADLDRFRDMIPSDVGEWKTAAHGNQGGWHLADGLSSLPGALQRDNPEVALVLFGTNDTNWGLPEARRFEPGLRGYLRTILSNGTVPILSTLPPKKDMDDRVEAYNAVIRRVARDMDLPLVDYYGAMIRRRPRNWYRTLIIGDGVHPSFPQTYQRDMTEDALRDSGFTLRNFLAMEAVLAVLDRIRQPDEG